METLHYNTIRICTTLHYIYWLLYYKRHIQITSNHSIMYIGKQKAKSNRVNEKIAMHLNTLRIYILLYHTYLLLYCK